MKMGIRVLWYSTLLVVLIVLTIPSAVMLAQESKTDLSLRMIHDRYYQELTLEEDNALFMEIRNNGDEEVTNISFESNKPEGWIVDFKPTSIDSLTAGSSQTIDINVIPGLDTERGEYTLTFLAEANETRAATSTTIRIENGSYFWPWVGAGFAAIAIAISVIVYIRFGKQQTASGNYYSL